MYNIASNTFRELFRNRILSLILIFACLLIGFSLVLASLSLGDTHRIIIDFGLAMIEIGGLVSVVFVGGQILFREIEGKTIYLILSKPIARYEFILGKFFGFGGIIAILVFLQGGLLLGLLMYKGIVIDPLIFVAILAIFCKLLLVFAVILLFSTFTSPLLSILFTIGVYIAAHGINGVLDIAIRNGESLLIRVSQGLLTILPGFEALNTAKNTIGTPVGLPAMFYIQNFAVAILYLLVVLLVTSYIFERKKFENV